MDIYQQVIRLAHLLQCDFDFPSPERESVYLAEHPELELIALLVMATKLSYPFDQVERHPSTATESAALAIDWNSWSEIYSQFRITKSSTAEDQERLFGVTEHDIMGMGDEELDEYLDWFQETWITDDPSKKSSDSNFQSAMYSMFPAGDRPEEARTSNDMGKNGSSKITEKIRAVQRSLIANVSDSKGPKPDSLYRHYRSEEELPRLVRPFFDVVARMVGVSLDILLRAVIYMEMKMKHWERRARKERAHRSTR